MMLPVLQEIAWHWRWVVRIQSRFETLQEQYLATVLAIGVFLLAVVLLYGSRRVLKDRISNDSVQAAQALILTVLSIILTGFLVAVWRVTQDVETALLEVLAPVLDPTVTIRILVSFIIIILGFSITRLSKRSIKGGVASDWITPHQREVAHHVAQVVLFVPAIWFIITLWNIPVQSLFLGAGLLGIIVGFAARQTLSGALSGFVILFARPFEVGDWIQVKDWEGIVTDVSLYNTQIRTFDEEHVLVPNDQVTGNEVINYSKTERLRLERDVGVDYNCDVAEAARIAIEAMEGCEPVADTPSPDVIRGGFGDSSIILRLRYWIDSPNIQRKWQAQNAVVEAVKEAFEEEDIKIPFPQQELMGRTEEGGLRVAQAGYVGEDDTEDGGRRRTPKVNEPVEEEHGNASESDPTEDEHTTRDTE